MGKLKELWEELKHQKDGSRRLEIQNEINRIETWMIENDIGSIKTVTNWNNQKTTNTKKKSRMFGYYPDEGWVEMGNFIIHEDNIEETLKILEINRINV